MNYKNNFILLSLKPNILTTTTTTTTTIVITDSNNMVCNDECSENSYMTFLTTQLEKKVKRWSAFYLVKGLPWFSYLVKGLHWISRTGVILYQQMIKFSSNSQTNIFQILKMTFEQFGQFYILVPHNLITSPPGGASISLFNHKAISCKKNIYQEGKSDKKKSSLTNNSIRNSSGSQCVQNSTCTKKFKVIKGKDSSTQTTKMNSLQSSISSQVPYQFSSTFVPEKLTRKFKVLLFTCLLLCSILDLTTGIKILSVTVPPHQKSGESVNLECNYDLEGDTLYSVKWYRGSNEFFRFVPAEKSPMQVFDLPGVFVNTALSDSRRVTLRSVQRGSSGKYKCEVSADLPSFHTVSKTAEMLVVDISNSVPNITGGRTRYHVGDEVHVNCSSAKSRPAASLMWYINDKQARSEELVEYAPEQDDDGLETSRLGLKFVVGAKDFPKGVLKIRCTATVAAVYWNSAEEAVEGQLPQTSPALESKGVYTGGSSRQGVGSATRILIIIPIFRLLLLFFSR